MLQFTVTVSNQQELLRVIIKKMKYDSSYDFEQEVSPMSILHVSCFLSR